MKGIFPASCRLLGYVLLLLSVFVPLLMYMFGQVNDGNLLYVKLGMKLVIWISLFMVFLAKMKDENEEAFCHSAESNGDFTLFVGNLLCRSVAECSLWRKFAGSRQFSRYCVHGYLCVL